MKLRDDEYMRLPANLQAMFRKLPNHGSDEVLVGFPETTSNPGTLRSNVQREQ